MLLVEAGGASGGAWQWSTYPGVAVDIPSFSCQFSAVQLVPAVADEARHITRCLRFTAAAVRGPAAVAA